MAFQSIVAAFDTLSILQIVCYGYISLFLAVAIKHRYLFDISSIPGPHLGTVATFLQTWGVLKGTAPVTLYLLHQKLGPIVRISYREVSVDHPEVLTIVLPLPVLKPAAYDVFAIPNMGHQNLMSQRSLLDFANMLRNQSSAYTVTTMIKCERAIDEAIMLLKRRRDGKISEHNPIELSQWLHFTTWDIMDIAT